MRGLVLAERHNAEALLAEARGQSRREIEKLLARWFPQPDTGTRIQPIMMFEPGFESPGSHPKANSSATAPGHSGTSRATGWSSSITSPAIDQGPLDTGPELPEPGNSLASATCPATGPRTVDTCPEQGNWLAGMQIRPKVVPLSAFSYRVEFTASAELFAKLERASELLSHAVPRGELPTLIERALDAFIEREMRRRIGTGKPRKRRPLKPGSRQVPREVARLVWERDRGRCTFVDAEGRRCSERRHLTFDHHHPFALGGPPTTDNICLLCANHNAQSARRVFGKERPTLSPQAALSAAPALPTEPAHAKL